jgi:cellulase/cellobiase CelA1
VYSIEDSNGESDSATVQITVKEKTVTNDSSLIITVSDDWGSGFTAQAQLTNISGKQIESWRVEFDYPYNIGNIWNAVIVSHSGTRYVIKNASWICSRAWKCFSATDKRGFQRHSG